MASKAHQILQRISDSFFERLLGEIVRSLGVGAGGGGFFLFFVDPENRSSLISYLQDIGLRPTNFKFEPKGIQSYGLA